MFIRHRVDRKRRDDGTECRRWLRPLMCNYALGGANKGEMRQLIYSRFFALIYSRIFFTMQTKKNGISAARAQ
jgi:hypothetical protein